MKNDIKINLTIKKETFEVLSQMAMQASINTEKVFTIYDVIQESIIFLISEYSSDNDIEISNFDESVSMEEDYD